jgi:chemotaxis protein CheC
MIALGELEQDALTEIFNIGVGLAAHALHQMTGEHVPLSVPVVELTSQTTAGQYYAGREQQLYAVRQTYHGVFTTDATLLFPQESSLALVRMMVGPGLPTEQLPEVAHDAMGELGNIILNAVISELASTLGLRLEGTLPTVSAIDADRLFTISAQDPNDTPETTQVLALTVDFHLSAQNVQGYLVFSLDVASTETLLAHLNNYVAGDAV